MTILRTEEMKELRRKIKIFLPLIWPKTLKLKIYLLLSLIFVVLNSIFNCYTRIYSKLIVDSMTSKSKEFRWDLLCLYALFNFMGEVYYLKDFFWTQVQQNIAKEIEVAIFSHIHGLSLRWHLQRKTGDILKILDRSTWSVTSLINTFGFYILPMFSEAIVSATYLVFMFDVWFALIVVLCLFLYTGVSYIEVKVSPEQEKKERESAKEIKNKSIDSLLNYETVKLFGNENHEIKVFTDAVSILNSTQLESTIIQSFTRITESFITNLSILIGGLICVYKVVNTEELTIGDYVLFSTYVYQLYSTVDGLRYTYSSALTTLIDIDEMYGFLKEEQEVKDHPNAVELNVIDGFVDFKNVFFGYLTDEPILKNVSFSVPSGSTTAIVGPSGSGKSTIMNLLFRFYDVDSGSIFVDEQDIKYVTQESLRKSLGLVPQDTVLFNNSIKYNIKYGKLTATDEEIIEAAKGSDIHKNIINFKDGYETEVGERGLRLSGGEKQRIAIARTILKSPKIILLDEATSSLDTKTERKIQESLKKICKNKTTIIIAHRLSTIIHADQILVLKNGVIIERGRHEDLLKCEGIYASMWNQQLKRSISDDISN